MIITQLIWGIYTDNTKCKEQMHITQRQCKYLIKTTQFYNTLQAKKNMISKNKTFAITRTKELKKTAIITFVMIWKKSKKKKRKEKKLDSKSNKAN